MEYKKHIVVLQTSFAKREDTTAYLEEHLPGIRIDFITDSSLLADIRKAGAATQPVIQRMTLYAMAAEAMGADLILNSCSTVGEVADIYSRVVPVPVIKIDDEMAKQAAELGDNIALIATLPTTLGPSRRAIERYGRKLGRKLNLRNFLTSLPGKRYQLAIASVIMKFLLKVSENWMNRILMR